MAKNNVAIIDDTPEDAYRLGVAAKRIGKFEPTLYDSTSAFRQKYNSSIVRGLRNYKAIICDNNFQTTDQFFGHNFLLNTVGPALVQIPERERPLVICFAPSSWEVIREHQEGLREFGILALHKHDQIAVIGLTLRIAAEGIVRPSPELVNNIIAVTNAERTSNLFFANDLAPEIYGNYPDANSFPAASAMLRDLPICSLANIRAAAAEHFGPSATELLGNSFPSEGSWNTKEG